MNNLRLGSKISFSQNYTLHSSNECYMLGCVPKIYRRNGFVFSIELNSNVNYVMHKIIFILSAVKIFESLNELSKCLSLQWFVYFHFEWREKNKNKSTIIVRLFGKPNLHRLDLLQMHSLNFDQFHALHYHQPAEHLIGYTETLSSIAAKVFCFFSPQFR